MSHRSDTSNWDKASFCDDSSGADLGVPLTFKIGDKAVYPSQGIAEVTDLERREIHGKIQHFYVLRLAESGLRILVPVHKAQQVGLRPVAGTSEVEEVLQILREKDVPLDRHTWNRRYRGFMDKIKSGSLFEVAEVFRDLHRLKRTKPLSFGERRMLDTAKDLIVQELCVAQATAPDAVDHVLTQALAEGISD
ncbi:MAG: CarD family transcriptional regulator [Deltaproteobacteria bacterium]|nr:CarD family transcriptional regulator [Deltaproteobacteria bacterium]